jgi:SRSO17 transposase
MGIELEEVERWGGELRVLQTQLSPYFARSEPRQRAIAYLRGLLSDIPRKNGWQLAEQAGERTPDGMQRLLSSSTWSADALRDELQRYVREHLSDAESVLVVDETGFLKKGSKSVGVKRQYSGTAGRIENCQIGVFLAYASAGGHGLIDRELYLPQEWAEDGSRRAEAHVPEAVAFRTKPELAQQMLERAFSAGLTCAWVIADSIYGGARNLRLWLEAREQPFVLGVAKNEALWCGFQQLRAEALARDVPAEAWQRLSCGNGAKGPRLYDWALVPLPRLLQSKSILHALLVRRSLADPTDLAYYVVYARADVTLPTLVGVAGQRWKVEECFELAKAEVGLDHYEVRHWEGWYRHITLSLWALAFLVVIRVQAGTLPTKKAAFPPGTAALVGG